MHRPQARRARQGAFARGTLPQRTARRSVLWWFALAALGLVAIFAGLGQSRAATATGLPLPAPAQGAVARTLPALDPSGAQAAPHGRATRVRERLLARITAYSASVEEGTAWGITYTGVRARPGTVAVDPAVIPLGSYLRIAGLPGLYRAEDTGGGIRGAHVDVFMESRAAALEFGYRRAVVVEVLADD